MENLDEIKTLLNSIDIYSLIDEAFKTPQIQKTAIEFNQDQLQDGKDALNQTIVTIGGSPYRAYTVKIRKSNNLQTNKVDLKFSGEFYKTFKVIVTNEGYEITADFEKENGSILDNFSSSFDFLGLDKESLTELVLEHVYNYLYNALRKQLKL